MANAVRIPMGDAVASATDIYDPQYIHALPGNAELDHRQAALFLRMSESNLYNLCSAKQGPQRIKERHRVFYVKADLVAWRKASRKTLRAHT